jgi:hypothetical protein
LGKKTLFNKLIMTNSEMVMAFVRGNDFFDSVVDDGKDLFVPSKTRYPHIHMNKGFVTYTKNSSNHSYLLQGDSSYRGRVETAKQDCGDSEIMQICSYIISQFT